MTEIQTDSPRLSDALDENYARQVHADTLTLDAHLDIRNGFHEAGADAGGETDGQFDLPKLERGQLDVAVVALAADPIRNDAQGQRAARTQVENKLAALRRFVADHPERLAFARSAEDLQQIPRQGRHAILLSFLNAVSLGEDLGGIQWLYDEGVRLFGFAHKGNNSFAYSSRPTAAYGDEARPDGGFTELGRRGIAELNRLGIILDVSQLAPEAVRQALQLSRAPVIASHSAIRGRVDSPRNLSNAELRAIAETGGVVHIVAFAPYVRSNDGSQAARVKEVLEPWGLKEGDDPRAVLDAQAYAAHRERYRQFSSNRWRFASLVDYLDAVDYAVRLLGIDHVGLSSDFNNGGGVTGYVDVGDGPNLTRELLRRGYNKEEIAKLWGGNFLRVFAQVEAAAG